MPTLRKSFRTRRGRPPASQPAIDKGTPELNAKRAAGRTDEVLDALYKQNIISEQELRCALNFRRLYMLRFGRPTVQALDLQRTRQQTAPQNEPPLWQQQKNDEYRAIANALNEHGLLASVLRVAVFDDPRVLHKSSTIRAGFLRGLDVLITLHVGTNLT